MQVKYVQIMMCQSNSVTAAIVVQVKQVATSLGLKGKGGKADLIAQIMKTRSY